MAASINFDPSRQERMDFDLRGGIEIDVPILTNRANKIGVIDRQYLGDFITGAGWIEREGPFPETFKEIDRIADRYPDDLFEVYETVDGERYGYKTEHLIRAIGTCDGHGGFDPADFALYHPTGTDAGPPFLTLVSAYTPEEFVIHRLLGDEDSFLQRFGAGACPACETEFGEPFVDCPDCHERPDSVQSNIEKLQAAHDGVLVLLAPVIKTQGSDDSKLEDARVRRPGEYPDPEITEVESPGAA